MKSVLLYAVLILVFNTAFCQDRVQLNMEQIAKAQKVIPSKTLQSSNTSGFISYNNFAKLSATNDGVTAEGNINYVSKKAVNFSFNVSMPVTSKSQSVKPLTLAGLSGNSSISMGAQKIWWGDGFHYDVASYNSAIEAAGGNIMDFNYDNLTHAQQMVFDKIANIDWGTAYYLGIKTAMQQQTFNYVANPVSFAAAEASKTAFKGAVTAGMLRKWGILALTFTHKSGYIADDPETYLVPVNNRGVQVQRELSPAAPLHQNSELLRFEYLSSGYTASRLRVNPNVNVALNQKVFSFEIPVYFLTADADRANFNGGVYAGYISNRSYTFGTDTNNFGFGVFIGATFTNLFQ